MSGKDYRTELVAVIRREIESTIGSIRKWTEHPTHIDKKRLLRYLDGVDALLIALNDTDRRVGFPGNHSDRPGVIADRDVLVDLRQRLARCTTSEERWFLKVPDVAELWL